jgi:cell division septum initiation protein DivIVA
MNNEKYELLLSEYEKLKEENKQLNEELAYINIGKDILFGVDTLLKSTDVESLNQAHDLIKKRHLLAQILGM